MDTAIEHLGDYMNISLYIKNHIIVLVLLAILFGFGCDHSRYMWIKMSTSSMEPTIQKDDKVLIEKKLYIKNALHRFDVVLIRLCEKDIYGKDLPENLIIKRIIGLPGEEILLNNGTVSINGQVEQEPFTKISDTRLSYYKKLVITSNSVFVLGDNRPISRDSRHFGAVPIKAIIGKVLR